MPKFVIQFDRRVWIAAKVTIEAKDEGEARRVFENQMRNMGGDSASKSILPIDYGDVERQLQDTIEFYPKESEIALNDVEKG